MKSFGQCLFNLRPVSFNRPLAICKDFSNLDSDSWTIVGLQENFKQEFPQFVPYFGNPIDCSNPHIVIIIGGLQVGPNDVREMQARGAFRDAVSWAVLARAS